MSKKLVKSSEVCSPASCSLRNGETALLMKLLLQVGQTLDHGEGTSGGQRSPRCRRKVICSTTVERGAHAKADFKPAFRGPETKF